VFGEKMETNAGNANTYNARMLLIQRCRRIGNITCVFIAIYALGWVLLGSHSLQSPYYWIISSLGAFIFAIVVAVNVLTFLLR
jgi:hypothetical protein